MLKRYKKHFRMYYITKYTKIHNAGPIKSRFPKGAPVMSTWLDKVKERYRAWLGYHNPAYDMPYEPADSMKILSQVFVAI